MSLADFKGNVPGGFADYRTFERTTNYTGTPITTNESYLRTARQRSNNTSSRLGLIPGTTTPWRASTSFARSILWCSPSHYRSADTETTNVLISSTAELVGNNPRVNEFWPLFNDSSTFPEYVSNDYNRAVTECLLKLGDSKGQMLASLATTRQLVDMLAGKFTLLGNALLAVKRGQWNRLPGLLGLKSSKRVAGDLLEWQYGWKPFAEDVYAIADLLSNREPEALMIQARRNIKGSHEYEVVDYGDMKRTWKRKTNYVTTCHLTARLSDNWSRRFSQFGMINPATLAWELVPWSFVVDWVLPVGNYFEAFTATAGLTFVDGYTSSRGQGEASITWGPHWWSRMSNSTGEHKIRRFGFRRDRLTDFPRPLPYVKSPFSSQHTTNALALLAQLRK